MLSYFQNYNQNNSNSCVGSKRYKMTNPAFQALQESKSFKYI